MNTEQVTALVAGVPTILAAFTGLVVALKGQKNVKALGQQTTNALSSHLMMMHTDELQSANVKYANPGDDRGLSNRFNPEDVSRARRLVRKMEGKKL